MSGVVDNGTFAYDKELRNRNISPVFSQFGWHFEYKVRPEGVPKAPAFVIEIIALVGGLEYGAFIPSLSAPMGIRFANGFEFGLESCGSVGAPTVAISVVLAAGYKFAIYLLRPQEKYPPA